jgi:hypothetical protein
VQAQLWASNITFFPARYFGMRDAESREMGLLDPLPSASWTSITIFGGWAADVWMVVLHYVLIQTVDVLVQLLPVLSLSFIRARDTSRV